MKLANGIAPIPECINAGVNVGLGTDGDIRDMFRAMLLSALLQKVDRMDPSVMPADRALELATIGGAKAIGLDKYIGSIEKGKKGDIVIVDLCKPRLTPVLYGEHFNVISHLMYSGHGCDVDTVIIDGRVVVENRKIKTVEEQKVIEKASEEARDLLDRMPLKKA
jgi:5-methylthioadenosine/S-adenosylhomocysteine deaminase